LKLPQKNGIPLSLVLRGPFRFALLVATFFLNALSGAVERDKEDVEEGRVAGDDATMRRPEEGLFDFDNLHVESPQEEHAVSTQASIKFC
jgi:hypothetical protein